MGMGSQYLIHNGFQFIFCIQYIVNYIRSELPNLLLNADSIYIYMHIYVYVYMYVCVFAYTARISGHHCASYSKRVKVNKVQWWLY